MSYHNNEHELRSVIEQAQKFLNDRARLTEGFERTLAKCCIPSPTIEEIIRDVRAANFKTLDDALATPAGKEEGDE